MHIIQGFHCVFPCLYTDCILKSKPDIDVHLQISVYVYRYFDTKVQRGCPDSQIGPGLNANSKWYWPCRTSNTEDLLVMQNFYWSYKSFFNIKRKKYLKLTDNIYFFVYFLFIYFKYIRDILEEKLVNKMPWNVYWPCRTSWSLILLAQSHFWKILLAWGHRTTVSVEPCGHYWNKRNDVKNWIQKKKWMSTTTLCYPLPKLWDFNRAQSMWQRYEWLVGKSPPPKKKIIIISLHCFL